MVTMAAPREEGGEEVLVALSQSCLTNSLGGGKGGEWARPSKETAGASQHFPATTTTSTTYVPAACRGMTIMVMTPACSPQRYDNDNDSCLQPPHDDAHHICSPAERR